MLIIRPFKCDFISSRFVYFYERVLFCNGRCHGVTCYHRKCYVTCGHNIIKFGRGHEKTCLQGFQKSRLKLCSSATKTS